MNISSYTGILGTTGMVPYSTSKFGVRGFTEALRMELAGTAVKVTLVLSGATRTPVMSNSPLIKPERRETMQRALDNARASEPEAVAARVVRGIRRGSPRVLTGSDTRALDLITRIAPGRYSALLAKPMRTDIQKTIGG